MSQHDQYRYRITIETDDEAVLHCLRSLSQYAQMDGNKRIPWGGTKKQDWQRDGHRVKFHFTCSEYRRTFINEAGRLLPASLWMIIDESDNDPAVPQA